MKQKALAPFRAFGRLGKRATRLAVIATIVGVALIILDATLLDDDKR